ncbi:hypothetical protein TCAL_09641 [Tigriopus californicus]|uniref:Apple domain-containing protein n=1 Tax=Tigriopus californicus TaxID=6832 RepID=A0A553NXP0_TIGCA|nr:uncharacterized protein LOC131886329 [Tigriopus californicus]TRY70202.1 hypothetical protein TCAL_09641 [Tigriopus californicus]|eukprot:TCALIF_09641-PA protein Name:"Protein of unknown function" AED:0.25 eAED:0.25 QI:0/1/0.5/1/1/1/2/112/512
MEQLLTLILIVGTVFVGLSHGELQCFIPGECLDSLIVDISPSNNSRECLQKCQNTRGCEWFTYYNQTKLCASLTTCLNLNATHCTDCISGEDECPEFICGAQGSCLGASEGIRVESGLSSCRQTCSDSAKCHWFTFDNSSNVCTLTADCPALDKRCQTCAASEQFCDEHDIRRGWAKSLLDLRRRHDSSNGTSTHPPLPESEREVLFVVAGSDITGVELVDLKNKSMDVTNYVGRTNCAKPANYPIAIVGAAGAVFDELPYVCGGDLSYGRECHRYEKEDNTWHKAATMKYNIANMSFAQVPREGLWLSGGDSKAFQGLSNLTMLVLSDKIKSGPELPYPEKYHCLTMLREGINSQMTVVMSGGLSGPKTAWLFEFHKQTWIPLPNMHHAHTLAMCESIKTSRGVELIVAGGFDEVGQTQENVEVLSVKTRKWRMGRPLPMKLAYGATLYHYETFLLIGGYISEDNDSNMILEYQGEEQKWIVKKQRLKKARSGHVAMWVKKKHLQCDSSRD